MEKNMENIPMPLYKSMVRPHLDPMCSTGHPSPKLKNDQGLGNSPVKRNGKDWPGYLRKGMDKEGTTW